MVPIQAKREHSADSLKFQTTRLAVITIYAGKEIGSGSLVDRQGLVITNYHVVQGVMGGEKSGWLSIKTSNGHRYPGQVIRFDHQHDLALIQLNAWKYFPTVSLADAENIRVGQQVFALGSPFGYPGVLTRGTLNRVRSNGDLQSQLILHPGNSGGPLLNSQGEMIGINRGILQTPSGTNTGISFATPIKVIKAFISQDWANAS
ncbi:trypsin-like peptidase domain-containing protein [Kovacikia minuta CCNUW1]|uniref:S1C family serine protease n=1 Tax=Kovacikia minuta TaxID=2931930 RepID=UPI001CCEE9C8|nr:trypsin-like peptidase domain-containing protein [Kovacikia minuta]UBF23573.1 trypsin-like peptidase domain-containing protein [Kovacikia minuta CCNUW1]